MSVPHSRIWAEKSLICHGEVPVPGLGPCLNKFLAVAWPADLTMAHIYPHMSCAAYTYVSIRRIDARMEPLYAPPAPGRPTTQRLGVPEGVYQLREKSVG